MKVAMIVPGGVDRSGVDRVIPVLLWLIERLARRHDVHVFATRQEPEPDAWNLLGARVHNIGTARGTARRLLARFGVEHRRSPFDVVHAFFGVCGAYASLTRWRHGVPVVYHPSGGEFVTMPEVEYGMLGSWRGRMALRLALGGAHRVTVASKAMQQFAAKHGVDAALVPLGVAIDRWPVRAPRRRDPTRALRLLHVGDLRPVKDQRTLLAAVDRLVAAGVDVELDVVGLDTMDGQLQRAFSSEFASRRTRWHGVLGREPLRAMMESADLLVHPSRHEAGAIVVLEAAVAGIPTVGTAVGDLAEWSPTAAVAVPVGDAESLAREIAALAIDEPRRLAIACEAQRRAVAMDADYTATSFERIYDELCSA